MTKFNPIRHLVRTRTSRRVFRYLPLLVILVIMAVSAVPLRAQGSSTLSDGSVVTGTISDQAKLVIYSFNANPGDLVSALVVGTTDGMNPSVSLMSPAQQQLANNDTDPFGLVGDSSARATYRIRDAGTYSLLVGGSNGQYVLRFHSRAAGSTTSLQATVAATANILPGSQPQSFSFAADTVNPTVLTLSTSNPNFTFVAQVYDGNGQQIAALGGSTLQAANLTFSPGNDIYEVLVSALQSNMQGAVSLLVAPGSGSGVTPANPPTLAPTPEQSTPVPAIPSAPQAPAGVCSATSAQPGAVNIRSGPGTNYPIISQLLPNTFLTIQGISADGTWYVNVQGGMQSWVFSNVVLLNGPCASLPAIVPPPPPPTFAPTATNTPTTVPVSDTPTMTYTPSATATLTNTPKPPNFPTFVLQPSLILMQTAPIDLEPHAINIASGSGALLANSVSSPTGDQTDTINYKVTWAYVGVKTLSIAATCKGTNTQNATFTIKATSVKCGGSFIAGINSLGGGTLTVKTTGSSFVNYTLTFTWV